MRRTRVCDAVSLAVLAAVLEVAFPLGAAALAASPPAIGPPSVGQATRAFAAWLRDRYPGAVGYWSCPIEQVVGSDAECLAEVTNKGLRHLVGATATLAGNRVVFLKPSDTAWRRRWSAYSASYLRGFQIPGQASVNSPAFDWAFLAKDFEMRLKRQTKSFSGVAYDGDSAGFERLFVFNCAVSRTLLTCRNSLGDAIRYQLKAVAPAIVFVRGVTGIWEMSANGADVHQLTRQPDASPHWSPDHRWIAFARGAGAGQDIWLIRPDGSGLHQVTHTYPGQAWGPTWSPDGGRIAFVCQTATGALPRPIGICVVGADGGRMSPVTHNPDDNEPAWSPDGKHIAFIRGQAQTLYVMDANGSNAHPVLRRNPAEFGGCQQGSPSWSPSSKEIAFECIERYAIWIVNADGTSPRRLVTGSKPSWSPDGSWLVFSADFAPPGSSTVASIYKIHPNATGLIRLTNSLKANDDEPDW
jgi:Tol biopolymer transport system component